MPYHVYAYAKTRCSDGAVFTWTDYADGPGTFNLEGYSEKIVDESGRGKPHGVKHRRYEYAFNDTVDVYRFADSNVEGSWGHTIFNSPYKARLDVLSHRTLCEWDVINNDVSAPPGWTIDMSRINESSLKEDCIEKAKGLKADVLLNLVEANQIYPAINSLATCLPAMQKNWRQIRKVVRTASGTFLAWKFGVSPILSDIMNIHRYAPKLASDIKRHGDGDKNRTSSKADAIAVFAPNDSSSSGNGFTISKRTQYGRVSDSPVVRYVLVTKPSRKYHTEFFNSLDVAMSRFASSPASLAWELVPFSFVVDWFVDLRGALRALDNVVGHSPFEVVSFTRSLSYGLNTTSSIARYSPCSGQVLQSHWCMQAEYKHYERSLVPMTASLPTWKPHFGKSQAAISAALISQALSRLRAR